MTEQKDQGIVLLSNVRLSFPHLIEPQERNKNGKVSSSYGCDLLMEPSSQGYADFMGYAGKLAIDTWKENAQVVMSIIQANPNTRCFGDGNAKINKKKMQVYEGYSGMVYITATRQASYGAPQLVDDNGNFIDPNNTLAYQLLARKMYGGCRVNVALKPWIQKASPKNENTNGIRCDLIAIQFAGDDDAFGESSPDITGVFKPVASASQSFTPPTAAMPATPFGSFMPPQGAQ